MANLYNDGEYKRIKKLINEKNWSSLMLILPNYLKKYPNDDWARLEFARLLKEVKQYQNALQQLYIIQHRLTEKDRKLKIDQYTTLEIYNLNFLMDRYEKSFQLLESVKKINQELFFEVDLLQLEELFLRKQLNLPIDFEMNSKYPYLSSQIYSYDEEKAIQHIMMHKYKEITLYENLFEEEIDVEKLFNQVKSVLEDSEALENDYITWKYYFEYPNVENPILKEEYPYKYLMVVVIKNTNHIISIYPHFSKTRLKCNLLEKQKIKRLSQIEKFNQKYKK